MPFAQPATKPRVLVCDDTPTIRMLVTELLSPHYDCLATSSARETLAKAPDFGPNLIITDLIMEEMDGIQLCQAIKSHPQLKRIPVVLLTSKSDSDSRAMGLESGADDYLFKPFQERELLARVRSLVRLHQSTMAEAMLLAQTLSGSVKMLCDLLAMISPQIFGRSTRARQMATQLAVHLKMDERWTLEVAAMLSQIGYVTLPASTIKKLFEGLMLNDHERAMVARMPLTTESLLANIPRLEPVREILINVQRSFDEPGNQHAGPIPWEARALKIILDFDELEARGMTPEKVFASLRRQSKKYDPHLLEAFAQLKGLGANGQVIEVGLAELQPRMVLVEEALDSSGAVLIARGQEITPSTLEWLKNSSAIHGVREPLRVRLL